MKENISCCITAQALLHGYYSFKGCLTLTNSCKASGIELIEGRCPLEEDLFDTFSRTSVGAEENKVQIFHTASSNSEPIGMLFSCLLEVCYAPLCKIAILKLTRRKRTEEGNQGAEDGNQGAEDGNQGAEDGNHGEMAKSMEVRSLFLVGLGDPVFVKEETTDNCVEVGVYFPLTALLGFFQFILTFGLIYYWRELVKIKISLKSENRS